MHTYTYIYTIYFLSNFGDIFLKLRRMHRRNNTNAGVFKLTCRFLQLHKYVLRNGVSWALALQMFSLVFSRQFRLPPSKGKANFPWWKDIFVVVSRSGGGTVRQRANKQKAKETEEHNICCAARRKGRTAWRSISNGLQAIKTELYFLFKRIIYWCFNTNTRHGWTDHWKTLEIDCDIPGWNEVLAQNKCFK